MHTKSFFTTKGETIHLVKLKFFIFYRERSQSIESASVKFISRYGMLKSIPYD